MPAPTGTFETWDPDELGMSWAAAISLLLVLAIAAFCYWASVMLAPKPKLAAIQVTQAQLVTLPKPTPPPPPPKVIPPPKPLPALIPKPIPVPSKIVVATKPPPPIHHVYKPVPRPIVHAPAPPVPVKTPPPAPAAPPAPPTSGIPIYGHDMYEILQANQNVPQILNSLGVSGTAYIAVTVAQDGHVISARVQRSSGNALIDKVALQHAQEAHFPAFSADMPSGSVSFTVPVNIQPSEDDSSNSSDSSDSN